MEQALLTLRQASLVKNGARILDGLTLTIREGQHTAILGPNGAGKTSLINLLTHQDRPFADGDAAPVEVFGDSRWNIFELRARIGVVSQDLHQRFVSGNSQGFIRGREAVISGLTGTYGIVGGDEVTETMRRGAADALELVGAAHLAGKLFNEMSTGEARRVLIARALVTAPKALVLDEPTAGLDLVASRRFLEHVRTIARAGTTVVFVTHHVEDILPEINHVVFLKNGRITMAGDKASVLTESNLGTLFDAPITVQRVDEMYFARPIRK